MPRQRRLVLPGIPHHVTQRGNHGQPVFFDDQDRDRYLDTLAECAEEEGVRLWGYCLMTNHVHLIALPETEQSLSRFMKRTQQRHASWVNWRYQRGGHLWQARYFSCPMNEAYTWNALRYVELNPVRAGLVRTAAEYRWSSAQPHLGLANPAYGLECKVWSEHFNSVSWLAWLADPGLEALNARIRAATRAGHRQLTTEPSRVRTAGA